MDWKAGKIEEILVSLIWVWLEDEKVEGLKTLLFGFGKDNLYKLAHIPLLKKLCMVLKKKKKAQSRVVKNIFEQLIV